MGKDDTPEEALRRAGREIKLIVCDLDGTLLDSQKRISPENLAAIGEARQRGIFVTICSGRVHPMLEAYSRALDIRGPLIAANGGVIFDTKTDRVIHKQSPDPEKIYALLRFCAEGGMDHILITARACYYPRGSVRIGRFEQYNEIARRGALKTMTLIPFDFSRRDSPDDDIYKVLISGVRGEERVLAENYIASLGGLSITSSEPNLLDVAAGGVNKGAGVRILAAKLGLEKRHICVFGDYDNDIPMMREAALPIAMANGDEKVKAAALAVSASNDEDGVARAIRAYLL